MIKRNHHKKQELMNISKMLAQLYKDGISINESLDVLKDSIYDKRYKDSIKKINMYTRQGQSLSESFKEFEDLYPSFFTGLIFIGENTGKLYETLNGLSLFYEKYINIISKIKSAFTYPCFILVTFLFLMIFMIDNIMPNFFEIYKSLNIPMPESCMFLYNLDKDFENNFIINSFIMFSVVGLIVLLIYSIFKRFNFSLIKNIKIVKNFMEYMTVLIFSIICNTGINISYALSYCKDSVKPNYLNEKINEINNELIKGQSLTEALEESGLLSKYSLAVVRVREKSGSIDDGFKELANSLENNLLKKINKYLARINPACIVLISILIAVFLFNSIIPLFDNLNKGIM